MGKVLKLREALFTVEEDRMHGSQGHTTREVASMMLDAIKETAG